MDLDGIRKHHYNNLVEGRLERVQSHLETILFPRCKRKTDVSPRHDKQQQQEDDPTRTSKLVMRIRSSGRCAESELMPIGKWTASAENSLSRNGREGMLPPSRMCSGLMPHSSSMQAANASKYELWMSPSHHSATWLMST